MRRPRRRKPLEEKLWSRVDRRGTDECWPWTGGKSRYGYGHMGHGRDMQLASHRVAWAVTHGPIPDGLCVLHRCDNPPCCNPAHLFLGTKKENTHDMVGKGRGGRPPVMRGDRNAATKVPDADVEFIRTSGGTAYPLAAKYGVCVETIRRIRRGQMRAAA